MWRAELGLTTGNSSRELVESVVTFEQAGAEKGRLEGEQAQGAANSPLLGRYGPCVSHA